MLIGAAQCDIDRVGDITTFDIQRWWLDDGPLATCQKKSNEVQNEKKIRSISTRNTSGWQLDEFLLIVNATTTITSYPNENKQSECEQADRKKRNATRKSARPRNTFIAHLGLYQQTSRDFVRFFYTKIHEKNSKREQNSSPSSGFYQCLPAFLINCSILHVYMKQPIDGHHVNCCVQWFHTGCHKQSSRRKISTNWTQCLSLTDAIYSANKSANFPVPKCFHWKMLITVNAAHIKSVCKWQHIHCESLQKFMQFT